MLFFSTEIDGFGHPSMLSKGQESPRKIPRKFYARAGPDGGHRFRARGRGAIARCQLRSPRGPQSHRKGFKRLQKASKGRPRKPPKALRGEEPKKAQKLSGRSPTGSETVRENRNCPGAQKNVETVQEEPKKAQKWSGRSLGP